MDIHLSENGTTTADKVHERERFRTLVGDIQELPETQRTALVLREMDALSYEQIAEAMETTVPGVKSLLVRARIALAEAAEARQLSCEDVRLELGEVAEGIRKKPDALARRHLKSCTRCSTFQGQLKKTNKAIAAVLPLGPLAVLKKLALFHIGHSAGAGSGAAGTTAGATSAGATGAGATGAGATAGVTGAGATGAGAAGAGAAGATASAAGAGAAGAAGRRRRGGAPGARGWPLAGRRRGRCRGWRRRSIGDRLGGLRDVGRRGRARRQGRRRPRRRRDRDRRRRRGDFPLDAPPAPGFGADRRDRH